MKRMECSLCDHLKSRHKRQFCLSCYEIWYDNYKEYMGQLEVIYSPDELKPKGYFVKAENRMYSVEEMEFDIAKFRDNYSFCFIKYFSSRCKCKRFKADNLKYLESLL